MPESKTIVVIGATGVQGGAVLKHLLANPLPFPTVLRGITRNTSSEKARVLAAQGVEVVQADLSSPESLAAAFKGAWAIFAMTDFFVPLAMNGFNWDTASEIEYQNGTNMARAAAQVETLEHYFWSSLPDSERITNGKVAVPFYQVKVRIDNFVREQEALLRKTTFLYIGAYETNLYMPLFAPIYQKLGGRYIALGPSPEETYMPVGVLPNVGLVIHTILSMSAESKKSILSTPEGARYVFIIDGFKTMKEYFQSWANAASGKTTQNGGAKIDGVEFVHILPSSFEKLYPGFGAVEIPMWQVWEIAGKDYKPPRDNDSLIFADDLLKKAGKTIVSLEESFSEMDWSMM